MRRSTTQEFIYKAQAIHGNLYNYEKAVYVTKNIPVTIICNVHGEFQQKPFNHLQGRGCPECGGTLALNTSSFIERAKKVHGNKYIYDDVNYIRSRIKVNIICPEHGVFMQEPANHIRGQGCPYCGDAVRYNESIFIQKARLVHGAKYQYDAVVYKNNKSSVIITCPIHGKFSQIASDHLFGYGCARCAGNVPLSNQEFIERAVSIHGNRYGYDRVRYVNSTTAVEIICPTHGIFRQTPHGHLTGNGCSFCAESRGELAIAAYLEHRGISFEREYRFPDCVYKRALPFDFYVPAYKLCIEFQGEHHRRYVPYFHKTTAGFRLRQHNDSVKKQYAERHGSFIEIHNIGDIVPTLDSFFNSTGVYSG